jgi:intron-binding protein aquarius
MHSSKFSLHCLCCAPASLAAEGKLMNDFTGRVRLDERTAPSGTVRTYTLALDTAQYQMDMNYLAKQQAAGGTAAEDVYGTFNLVLRRKVG